MATQVIDSLCEKKTNKFISMQRAAQISGYSIRHLRRLLEQNCIRSFEISGKRFVVACELYEWVRLKASN